MVSCPWNSHTYWARTIPLLPCLTRARQLPRSYHVAVARASVPQMSAFSAVVRYTCSAWTRRDPQSVHWVDVTAQRALASADPEHGGRSAVSKFKSLLLQRSNRSSRFAPSFRHHQCLQMYTPLLALGTLNCGVEWSFPVSARSPPRSVDHDVAPRLSMIYVATDGRVTVRHMGGRCGVEEDNVTVQPGAGDRASPCVQGLVVIWVGPAGRTRLLRWSCVGCVGSGLIASLFVSRLQSTDSMMSWHLTVITYPPATLGLRMTDPRTLAAVTSRVDSLCRRGLGVGIVPPIRPLIRALSGGSHGSRSTVSACDKCSLLAGRDRCGYSP